MGISDRCDISQEWRDDSKYLEREELMANSEVLLLLATYGINWKKALKPWGNVMQTLIDYFIPRKERRKEFFSFSISGLGKLLSGIWMVLLRNDCISNKTCTRIRTRLSKIISLHCQFVFQVIKAALHSASNFSKQFPPQIAAETQITAQPQRRWIRDEIWAGTCHKETQAIISGKCLKVSMMLTVESLCNMESHPIRHRTESG